VAVAAILVGLIFSAGANAAPGDLDLTFSGDGKQTTDFGLASSPAVATVRQPDGKIVAVGVAERNFALARYEPNGSLDTSFSGDGRQTTNFGGADGAHGVAVQGDGKIVAVGAADFGTAGRDFALARFNSNGSLDTSFSGDGQETTDFGGYFDSANAVALQGDGKIVVVGIDFASGDFPIARYNTDGSLDTSFSGDGKQTTDFGGSVVARGVALLSGKFVAVGCGGAGGDFALARYNTDGSLDTSFSGDGKQTTGGFPGFDSAGGVAVQGDGRIVVVGGAGNRVFALARYNPDGTLDTSFSGDGRQTTDFGFTDFDQARAVALQGDGKIVAVGSIGDVGGGDFALARYNADGSLDTSFSGDGKQTTNFGGPDDGATGVAVQANGKIVVVGGASGAGTGGRDFAIARYNPNGSLDTSFSGDGKQMTAFTAFGGANAVALQANGKIVAAGVGVSPGVGTAFGLVRYNADGSLDTSFSGDGKQTTDFAGVATGANGVAVQGDGKIVAAGEIISSPGGFALARYNADGSLDTSFSGDGKQTTNFAGVADGANGVALQGSGKIIAAGATTDGDGNPADFALARYNPNGSLDTSFSGDGRQATDFGGSDGANGVALQGGGKIVAVGVGLGTAVTNDFALARYLGG
jgi:uncharacterized delta-60 repeat protein